MPWLIYGANFNEGGAEAIKFVSDYASRKKIAIDWSHQEDEDGETPLEEAIYAVAFDCFQQYKL